MTQEPKKPAEYDNAGLVQLAVELYARMGMSNSDTFNAPYKEAKEELLKRLAATPPPQGLAKQTLIRFLEWMNETTQKNPMALETDNVGACRSSGIGSTKAKLKNKS